jgi:multiple sugar transport system substrate-binding protein
MKRSLVILGAAAVAAVTLAACSSGSSSGSGSGSGSGNSASSGTTTIQFWVRSDIEPIAKEMVSEFNATHKTIKVNLTVTPDTYEVEKLGTAIASGNAPDVVALNDIDVPQFATEDQLENIGSEAKALSFYKDLSPGQLSLGTYQGNLYGVPFDADLSILNYNKTLFTKAGLNPNDPPTTWPEIINDAKKITALGHGIYGFDFQGDCSGCFVFTGLPFIWAAGGNIFPPNGTHATLTSAGVTDALNFYKTLWDDKVTPPSDQGATGATWGAAYEAGKIGMEPFDAGLGLAAQKAGVDEGITPIPGPNGGESTFAGGDDMVILAGSQHQAAAWTFTQWALGIGPQTLIANNGFSPVRSDIVTAAFKAKYPLIAASLAALPYGNDPVSAKFESLTAPSSPWIDMWETAIFRGDVTGAEQTAEAAFNSTLGGLASATVARASPRHGPPELACAHPDDDM